MAAIEFDYIDGAMADQFEVVDHLLLMSREDNLIICTLDIGDWHIIVTCASHWLTE